MAIYLVWASARKRLSFVIVSILNLCYFYIKFIAKISKLNVSDIKKMNTETYFGYVYPSGNKTKLRVHAHRVYRYNPVDVSSVSFVSVVHGEPQQSDE